MPFSSDKLKKILAITNISWNDAGGEIIAENHKISPAIYLFNKIELGYICSKVQTKIG